MANIADIEGIGPVNAGKLKEAGVSSTDDLLSTGATARGRQALSEKTGISGHNLLEWVNRADLFRIKGVGEEFSDLLESAGVDTVPELAQRNAENLHARLTAVNTEKKLTRRVPTAEQIEAWIAQAKTLPRVVEY
jgi:predicted flap endonuclease-1-like 5' DNA nuclease